MDQARELLPGRRIRLDGPERFRPLHPERLVLDCVFALDREAPEARAIRVGDVQAEHDHVRACDRIDRQSSRDESCTHPDLLAIALFLWRTMLDRSEASAASKLLVSHSGQQVGRVAARREPGVTAELVLESRGTERQMMMTRRWERGGSRAPCRTSARCTHSTNGSSRRALESD